MKNVGLPADDRVGLSGLEKWGEQYLAGKRGGALYVRDAQGQPVTRLAEATLAARAIHLYHHRPGFPGRRPAWQWVVCDGAAVVLERDTGRVLAMVSSPDFDPNAFEPVNFNSEMLAGRSE